MLGEFPGVDHDRTGSTLGTHDPDELVSDVVGNLVGVLAFALDNDVLVPAPELEIDTTIEMRAAMPHPLDLVSLPPIMLGDKRLER